MRLTAELVSRGDGAWDWDVRWLDAPSSRSTGSAPTLADAVERAAQELRHLAGRSGP